MTSKLFTLQGIILIMVLLFNSCKSDKQKQKIPESTQSQHEIVVKSYASLLYYWSELRDKEDPELLEKMRKNVDNLDMNRIESSRGRQLFVNARKILMELESLEGYNYGFKLGESSHELGKIKTYYNITKEDLEIYRDEELIRIMDAIDALMKFSKGTQPKTDDKKENSREAIIDKFVIQFKYWVELNKDKSSTETKNLENELRNLNLNDITDTKGKAAFLEAKKTLLTLRELDGHDFGFKSGEASHKIGLIMAHYKITSDDLKRFNDDELIERRDALERLMKMTGQWPD